MSEGPEQTEGLEIVPTADGFVVYDAGHDRVHYLNHTAALILEFATGENSPEQITHMVQVAYDLPQPPVELVGECLEQLREQGLITDGGRNP